MSATLADAVQGFDGSDWTPAPSARTSAPPPSRTHDAEEPAAEPAQRYGEGRRPSLPGIVAIVAAHGALLWALAALDVVHLAPRPREPTLVTLIPEPVEPPPAPRERPKTKVEAAKPELVAPPPIVQAPVATTVQVAVAVTPAPPQPAPAPVVVAAPAADATPVPAPVVPPSPLGTGSGNKAPDYPIEARRQRWTGTVRLRVVISTDGAVKDISVASSSGHDLLDKVALKAVARWKFRPATSDGVAVEGVGYVPIPFVLRA